MVDKNSMEDEEQREDGEIEDKSRKSGKWGALTLNLLGELWWGGIESEME